MTFEKWYEDHVKYMTTADFKPWLHEAWDAGKKAETNRIELLMLNINLIVAAKLHSQLRLESLAK